MASIRTASELGLAIRARRKELALDQATLAERVGVTRQWVIDIEKGKPRAELELVMRTLRALDLNVLIEKPGQVNHSTGYAQAYIAPPVKDVLTRLERSSGPTPSIVETFRRAVADGKARDKKAI
jgi:HTH-type transcriptional regulator/antitoxin HipB